MQVQEVAVERVYSNKSCYEYKASWRTATVFDGGDARPIVVV
jgi:hypothetical protein